MITRRRLVLASAAGVASLASRAHAQVISKVARVIVGFPPGGSTDVVGRLLAEHMKGYAPTVIVDNRPGAGGRVAMELTKVAAPDGAAMVLVPASVVVVYPHLYKALGYDPLQHFAAVTTVCAFPYVLSIGPMVPREIVTLADFIQWCRDNPRRASYGTSGAGST